VLEKTIELKILDFVRQRPRTVQEIAALIEKNWRTAERYVERIATETGLIATRTFREGTRGALKIVFWNALDSSKGSAYQERLLAEILHAKRKEEFSPLDVYQFVPENKREAYLEKTEFSKHPAIRFDKLILEARHQVLFLSGNLSWMELGASMDKAMLELGKRGVDVKVLTRVDITSEKNTKAMLAINQRIGKDIVQIRHCEQPLRAIIIDDLFVSMKEVLSPLQHRELKEKKYIFYIIKDPDWISWMQKVFWHLWERSIDAETRLSTLKTLKTLR